MSKKRSAIALAAIVIAFAASTAMAVTTTDPIIDDSAPGWIWNRMDSLDDSSFQGGSSHVGGPGSYGAYTFSGTGVDVFAKSGPSINVDGRRHKIGSLKVSIDGSLKADQRLYRTDGDDNINAFTISGLTPGNHVLQVEPDGGWVAIDYITVRGGAAATADPASSTPGHKTNAPSTPTGTSVNDIPDGKTISLLANANRMFVTVSPDPNKPIVAKGKDLGAAQEFVVESQGGGYVTLRSVSNNLYVCVSPVDNALYAVRPAVDKSVAGGELFHWESNQDGTVSLKSYSNQMYLSANVSPSAQLNVGIVLAYRITIADWEKFTVSPR